MSSVCLLSRRGEQRDFVRRLLCGLLDVAQAAAGSSYAWLGGREAGAASAANAIKVATWQALCLLAPHVAADDELAAEVCNNACALSRLFCCAVPLRCCKNACKLSRTLTLCCADVLCTARLHVPQALSRGWACLLSSHQHSNIRPHVQLFLLALFSAQPDAVQQVLLPALGAYDSSSYQASDGHMLHGMQRCSRVPAPPLPLTATCWLRACAIMNALNAVWPCRHLSCCCR